MIATLEDFRSLLEEVLERTGFQIRPETVAKDVPDWDSLNHVRLLVRIEQRYGIDLPVSELEESRNVGELLEIVNRLLAQKNGVSCPL